MDRVAELVLDIVRGTMNGPILLRAEPFSRRSIGRLDLIARSTGPPEPMIQPGALALETSAFLEPRILDRFLHGEIVVGRPVAHEAAHAPVDRFV